MRERDFARPRPRAAASPSRVPVRRAGEERRDVHTTEPRTCLLFYRQSVQIRNFLALPLQTLAFGPDDVCPPCSSRSCNGCAHGPSCAAERAHARGRFCPRALCPS